MRRAKVRRRLANKFKEEFENGGIDRSRDTASEDDGGRVAAWIDERAWSSAAAGILAGSRGQGNGRFIGLGIGGGAAGIAGEGLTARFQSFKVSKFQG